MAISTFNVWEQIVLKVDQKEYPISHSYLELLAILELEWLFDIRDKCPFWNIRGIGLLELKNIDFNNNTKIMKINCKIIS
jgi:hypothetical protein